MKMAVVSSCADLVVLAALAACSGLFQSAEALPADCTFTKSVHLPKSEFGVSPNGTTVSSRAHTATSARSHYFVCFTGEQQVSRGDIASDSRCCAAGTAGSSFITSAEGIRVVCGYILLQSAQVRHQVFAGGRQYTLEPGTRAVFGPGGRLMSASCSNNVAASAMHCVRSSGAFLRNKLSLIRLYHEANKPDIGSSGGNVGMAANKNGLAIKDQESHNLEKQAVASLVAFATNGFPGRDLLVESLLLPEVYFLSGARSINALAGEMMAPPHTIVRTTACALSSRSDIVASVRTMNNSVFVENCMVPGELKLALNDDSFVLEPGRCAIVKPGPFDLKAMPLDAVARRRYAAYSNNCISLITADFSLASLLASNGTALSVVNRPISANERKLASTMIKSSVALAVATSNRGPYGGRPANIPLYRLSGIN